MCDDDLYIAVGIVLLLSVGSVAILIVKLKNFILITFIISNIIWPNKKFLFYEISPRWKEYQLVIFVV